ncbi:MAG TPA: hypothetical protein VGE96_02765 [Steroidobacteraceae bacterium]|jgi:hypothetical protein
MPDRNELLQPSLGRQVSAATSIYSTTTGYLAAFFGGPLGGAAIALTNSWRLRRLGRDWPLALVALALTGGMAWWEQRAGGLAWLNSHFGNSGQRFAVRVVGIAMFAVIYLIHRRYYRNMDMMNIKPPSGWVPGIAAIVGGIAAMMMLGQVLAP